MSTSVLVEGHSISGTATLQENDSYLAAKLPYTRTDCLVPLHPSLSLIPHFSSCLVPPHSSLLRPQSHLLYGEDTAAVRPLN